jgi:uncharacterized protein (DUF433 family)
MKHDYVEVRDDAYWIAGTRVGLDSVVIAFQQGYTPEAIATECFPTLTPEQVNGAIAYYLAHREAVDAYLQRVEEEYARLREAARKADPSFVERLAAARRRFFPEQG